MPRFEAAGGELLLCLISLNAGRLDGDALGFNHRLGGTVQLGEWTGDGATTSTY